LRFRVNVRSLQHFLEQSPWSCDEWPTYGQPPTVQNVSDPLIASFHSSGQPFQLRLLLLTPALVVDWAGRPTILTQTNQVIGRLSDQ
jgi:hypothetical protein